MIHMSTCPKQLTKSNVCPRDFSELYDRHFLYPFIHILSVCNTLKDKIVELISKGWNDRDTETFLQHNNLIQCVVDLLLCNVNLQK